MKAKSITVNSEAKNKNPVLGFFGIQKKDSVGSAKCVSVKSNNKNQVEIKKNEIQLYNETKSEKSPKINLDVKQSNDKKINQFKTNDVKQNGQVSNQETKSKNKVLKILGIQRKDLAKRVSVRLQEKESEKMEIQYIKINVIRQATK